MNSVVRIGCFKQKNIISTKGTGFIVKYRNKYFIITCKHVILSCETQSYFVLINTTNEPISQDKNKYIKINTPLYHPKDTESESKDIAIFAIKKGIIKKNKLKFWELDHQTYLLNDIKTIGMGYPNEYIIDKRSKKKYILKPYSIPCKYYRDANLSNLEQNNIPYFNVNDVCGAFIQLEEYFNNFSGISGGPLISIENRLVVGIIAFSGLNVKIKNRITPVLGIVPSIRIIETLETYF